VSTQKQKAEDFRRMHQAPPILVLPNAWDVASARIFESVGARAIATSSAGVAFALGYPDGQKISRRLMIESIARIAANVDLPVTADVDEAFASWHEECGLADEIMSRRALEATGRQRTGREVSMRWILNHMIEEYSRHNGHADLIRQAIDGATGY